ncbi:MAG: pyridoxamine 5'-phosphate oxidase family protein [Chloroflexi bacterium]|nr:pyridoxamine 5'-phosphate oxidase family protein [Chloroflexota bacterium]
MNDTQAAIRAFLEGQSTLALATSNDRGQAEVAPVFYVSDEAFNLYWLSSPDSRHSLNLAARPRAAATIYPAVWDWQDIRGLQIEGEAAVVTEMRALILARYRAKFVLPAAFEAQINASGLYVLKPDWIRWLDNGVRFGYKTELRL